LWTKIVIALLSFLGSQNQNKNLKFSQDNFTSKGQEKMSARITLNFLKIDPKRLRVGPTKATKEGGGLTAPIEYLDDNGVVRPCDIQLPDGYIPFPFSSFEDKGVSWTIAFRLDPTGIWAKYKDFLEKIDEFTLDTVYERAKEFVPKTASMKGFSKEMVRALQNSCIRYNKEDPTKYPPTFTTHVQRQTQKVGDKTVVIDGQYSVTCLFKEKPNEHPVAFDIRNVSGRSTGSGVVTLRAITVVNGKFGPSFDLKKLTLTSLGGSNEYQEDPNMYNDEHVEQNFYDAEAIKMVEQFERKREEREEEELSETSKKEQEQQQQEATPKKSKKQKK